MGPDAISGIVLIGVTVLGTIICIIHDRLKKKPKTEPAILPTSSATPAFMRTSYPLSNITNIRNSSAESYNKGLQDGINISGSVQPSLTPYSAADLDAKWNKGLVAGIEMGQRKAATELLEKMESDKLMEEVRSRILEMQGQEREGWKEFLMEGFEGSELFEDQERESRMADIVGLGQEVDEAEEAVEPRDAVEAEMVESGRDDDGLSQASML
jgi:hypothetical protein